MDRQQESAKHGHAEQKVHQSSNILIRAQMLTMEHLSPAERSATIAAGVELIHRLVLSVRLKMASVHIFAGPSVPCGRWTGASYFVEQAETR